jgi:Lrp/AsnC family transcriptional regulator
MTQLDSVDRHILDLLQTDASMSIQDIADRVRLSVNPCWRRIKRLEADGVIRARVALLDPARVGLNLTVYVRIRTNQHSAEWLGRFNAAVLSIPEISECHRIGGEVDYLLKAVVTDIAAYDRVYKQLISLVPGLSDVSALFSMEQIKSTTRVELPP